FHSVETGSRHYPAHLHFFAEGEQIRLHIEMLATPGATSRAEPGLDFVENQKDIILVANLPQLPKPLAAEMIVAALTLDWFDDDRGDVGPAFINEFSDLHFRFFLALDYVAFALLF